MEPSFKNCSLHNCQREGWSCRSTRTTTEQFDLVFGSDCCWRPSLSCAKSLTRAKRKVGDAVPPALPKSSGPDDLQGDAEGGRLPLAAGNCEVVNALRKLSKRFKL